MTQPPDPDMTQPAPADVRQPPPIDVPAPRRPKRPHPSSPPPQPGYLPPAPPVPAGYGYGPGVLITSWTRFFQINRLEDSRMASGGCRD